MKPEKVPPLATTSVNAMLQDGLAAVDVAVAVQVTAEPTPFTK